MLVYFVRHGQTDWNAGSRFQGQEEIEINATGRRQARQNGRRLAGLVGDPLAFDFVASPMRRTAETMEIVRGELGLPRTGYRTDKRLIEVNFGDWQGLTVDEVGLAFPRGIEEREREKWRFTPPGAGAESYEMLAARFRPWLEEVAAPTVCVTHGGILRAVFLLAGALGRAEAAAMEVPQDRVLRLEDGRLQWL